MSILPVLFVLLNTPFQGPCKDSYVIQIPKDTTIEESGSFTLNIIENDLSDNTTVNIEFPQTFTLSDTHGKSPISGYIDNRMITFGKDETGSRYVPYHIDEVPVGNWSGNISISISLERHVASNMLMEPERLNAILHDIRPNVITFTSETIDRNHDYDVSLKQDGSVLLYIVSDEEVIISNNAGVQIKANPDMSCLFKDITSLMQVNGINTVDFSQCQTIREMFKDNIYLSQINGIDLIDTSNIQDMSGTFENTGSLSSLDLNQWNTSSLKDSSSMFEGSGIASISLNNWNTEGITDSRQMFKGCGNLTSLNLSTWHMPSNRNMKAMFAGCSKLKKLALDNLDPISCEDLSEMFMNCLVMTTPGNLSGWNTTNVTDVSNMFKSCENLRNIGNISSWNTGNIINFSNLFSECKKLNNIGDLSDWDLSKAESLSGMFKNTLQLSNYGDPGSWNVSERCNDLSYMFFNTMDALANDLDLSNWNVSNVTNMSHMFYNVFSIKNLNISGWNTSNLEDASSMFECDHASKANQLLQINGIENLDVSSLKNISRMFYKDNYVNADLSAWNTASLQDISYAFYGTWHFDINKLKHWNVSSVVDMSECFSDHAGELIGSEIPEWYH